MPHVLGCFNPDGYGVLDIHQCFLGCLTVTHATREIGYGGNKPASLFRGQWFNHDCIRKLAHGKFLKVSANATSCLIYTGLIGLLKGTVNFAASRGWAIL